jgi:demethylmenaquinone methyltransferase/2-methoxy-6-polyprenyl-1,4-benzoquinol methylase
MMTAKVETREGLVEQLFHGTGSTYAEIVHIATWGRDREWKEQLLSRMDAPRRVLDLASGTGILSLEIARRWKCHVTGVELREEYCAEARERAAAEGVTDVRFIVSPAEHFVIDETFDHITTCYLPKYVSRLDVLVANMAKMLAPGGQMLMQDFAYPRQEKWRVLFENHFRRMQRMAREELSGWTTMFERLPGVIRSSTWIDDMVREMKRNGLVDVDVQEQSFGLSAIVSARQPG